MESTTLPTIRVSGSRRERRISFATLPMLGEFTWTRRAISSSTATAPSCTQVCSCHRENGTIIVVYRKIHSSQISPICPNWIETAISLKLYEAAPMFESGLDVVRRLASSRSTRASHSQPQSQTDEPHAMSRRLSRTANLTVILTLTLTSGAALRHYL